MKSIHERLSIAVLLALSVAMASPPTARSAEQVQVPDPSMMLPLVPHAADKGAPPVISPGTRLTYYGMSASVRGEYEKLVQDENGNWIDKNTGRRYRQEEIGSASGAGLSVVHVGRIAGPVAQLSTKLYVLDAATGNYMFSLGGGIVTHAGCAADYWIHPDLLGKVEPINRQGVRIVRMPYTVNNKTYKAIRFQTEDASGYNARVYDLETGLLIYHGSRTQGPPVMTPPLGNSGMPGLGRGSTQLTTGWIVEVKDIDVPWKNAAAPDWTGRVQQLAYSGAQSTMMPAVGSKLDRPMTANFEIRARGSGWLRFKNHIAIQSYPGMPTEQSTQDGASGNATIGGLWIPPGAMQELSQGTVLEQNPHVGITTTVSQVMPGYITVSEVGPLHRIDYTYDRTTGMMGAMNVAQQVGMATITHSVQLTDRR